MIGVILERKSNQEERSYAVLSILLQAFGEAF